MTDPVSKESTQPPKAPDWGQIEADYRAGVKPLRQIAEEHGITHGAINKRAKKLEWTRDLAGKINAKADALVSKAAVSSEVSAARLVTEKAVVDANATLQYQIRMEHRADIKRSRSLFQTLLGELEVTTTHAEQIEALFDEVHKAPGPDAKGPEHAAYNKLLKALNDVLSIPGRVDSGKKIVEMLEKLVRMEREAFGIVGNEGGGEAKSRLVFLPAKDAE